MLNLTRLGLAAALVVGSASLALAQTYDAGPGTETGQPNAAGMYVGSATQRVSPRTSRRHENVQPNYENSQAPWSSSFDPGNTSGN